MMNTLIAGVGTGRCGTTSLARLLSMQSDAHVTHERYKWKPRARGPAHLWPLRLWRDTAREEEALVGDVALQWTWQCRTLLRWSDETGRDVRIVGLRRDREATIASYLSWVGDKHHWKRHDGREFEHDPWDHAYPVYPSAESRSEAIGRYWDEVYEHLGAIRDDRLRVYETSALNDADHVARILEFVGVDDPTVKPGIHANLST